MRASNFFDFLAEYPNSGPQTPSEACGDTSRQARAPDRARFVSVHHTLILPPTPASPLSPTPAPAPTRAQARAQSRSRSTSTSPARSPPLASARAAAALSSSALPSPSVLHLDLDLDGLGIDSNGFDSMDGSVDDNSDRDGHGIDPDRNGHDVDSERESFEMGYEQQLERQQVAYAEGEGLASGKRPRTARYGMIMIGQHMPD
ncbi:hypothetical protein CVT25_011893 [Psilocybe cyanescens]|uniref:Uncharacterized protein n=1 Tax=Psilocybe cyanescens TaxID=93625 RepID=A0A409WIR2_PSICY|nr:hypothetical protein CVT25_011893 [Psilocybe cyanescens]